MQRIDGFSLYQKQLQESGKSRPEMPKRPGAPRPDFKPGFNPVDTFEKSKDAEEIDQTAELSEGAKKLLDELKEKYANMDFFVANYDSDEEAQDIMSHGTKEYSVLIEPETLEEMAASQEAYDKYTALIDEATEKFDDIREELGDDAQNIDRLSVVIDSDGNAKYFAHLQQMSDRQRERIEAANEEKKAEADKKVENKPIKRTTVSASSAGDLIAAIKNVDWEQVKAEAPVFIGARFDFQA